MLESQYDYEVFSFCLFVCLAVGEEHDDAFVLQLRAALTTQMMVMCLRVSAIMKLK